MRGQTSRISVLAALTVAALLSIPLTAKSLQKPSSFTFEIKLQSSAVGYAQIFYDIGRGYNEADSARVQITRSRVPILYKFPIPKGNYRALRFDPIDRQGTVTFSGAKILDSRRRAIRIFSASQFHAAQQISSLTLDGGVGQMTTAVGGNDPILIISIDSPFLLRKVDRRMLAEIGLKFFVIFVCSLGLLWLAEMLYMRRSEKLAAAWDGLAAWMNWHTKCSILGMAIFAVVLSCYPVVFLGKSFVSPNNGTMLLYGSFPTVPGYDDASIEDAKGSDVGAMMYQNLPYSVIEGRAIFKDFELPLWNRYNSCGVPLFGQGQSMLGDPLNFIVLVAEGASWAWDMKFLLAKLLFAVGLGLTVYAAVGHLPAALLSTFSSAFIGFFWYRFNHPAFFSMCYAPWILYCWLRIVQSPRIKGSVLWTGGLILANWTVMNSGTVKEAYMLLAFMNFTGFLVFLLCRGDKRLKRRKYLHVALGAVIFVLISTPVWITFLGALERSYTLSSNPYVCQIQPSLFIGLFDDIFYRQFNIKEAVLYPSANFLILLGFLWSLARVKELLPNRTYLAVGLSMVFPTCLVFGILPPSLIVKVPFLANVGHIDDVFSCVLIIELIVLAGFGLKACLEGLSTNEWSAEFITVLLLLSILLALYFGATQAAQRSSINFLKIDNALPKSTFFYVYVYALVCSVVALPFFIKLTLSNHSSMPAKLLLFSVCVLLLHWRYGMYVKTAFDDYVMNPQVRVDVQAKSGAVEFIKANSLQPFRAVGFGGHLNPGFNAALGIESISVADALWNPYYTELTYLPGIEHWWGWRIVIEERTLAQLKRFYDFLNIKYYLASPSQKDVMLKELKLVKRADLDVYESEDVWPRAFFTDTLSSYGTPKEFMDMVEGGDGTPFAAIQRSELARHPELSSLLRDQRKRHVFFATDYRLTNNTTSFRVVASSKGIIALSEAYVDRDFQVSVNGKPVHYFRVNHAFKGVAIQKPGRYIVSFSYWPQHFTISLWISGIGVCLAMIWFTWSFYGSMESLDIRKEKHLK